VREGDNIPDENHSPLSNLKIIVKKVRRKSHEVEEPYKSDKKKSKKTSLTGGLHRRCHSAVGLSRQDAFDSNDEERNRAAAFEALKYIEKNNNVYSSADSALDYTSGFITGQHGEEVYEVDVVNVFSSQTLFTFSFSSFSCKRFDVFVKVELLRRICTTRTVLLLRSVLILSLKHFCLLHFVLFLHTLRSCSISFFSVSPKLILQ